MITKQMFKVSEKEYEIKFVGMHDRFNGTVQGSFILHAIKPISATSHFAEGDVGKKQNVEGINFYKRSDIAKAACKLQKRVEQDVLFSLSEEAQKYIKDCADTGRAELRTLAETRKINNWVWAIGGDTHNVYISTDDISKIEQTMRPDLNEIEHYIEKNHQRANLKEFSHAIERDAGLYAPWGWNEISNDELMAIYTKLKTKDSIKKQVKDDAMQAIFETAKQTGVKQILRQWADECNDRHEECDIDNIIEYAMADGSVETERYHTW